MKSLLLSIIILILSVSNIECLDVESAKEQPCFEIKKTLPTKDVEWSGKVKTWYFPLMSRLDLYLNSIDILQKDAKDIGEASVYYDSCMLGKSHDCINFFSEGFGGLTRDYVVDTIINKTTEIAYKVRPKEGEGYSGTAYQTYTDGKTFLFTAFCTDDGQMTWNLATVTLEGLPQESVKHIHEHALSLGFKKEFFTELRYDQCEFPKQV